MSAVNRVNASNFVSAGKSAVNNSITALRAARENSPKYDDIVNESRTARAQEKAAAFRAESNVAMAGIRAERDVRNAKIKADRDKSLAKSKQTVAKAGKIAAASQIIGEDITEGRKAQAKEALLQRQHEERMAILRKANERDKQQGEEDQVTMATQGITSLEPPSLTEPKPTSTTTNSTSSTSQPLTTSDHSPEQRALLDTISWSEGTWRGGKRGYGVQFGGGNYDNTKPHPGTVISAPGVSSSAAGAYQFMPATWAEQNSGSNVAMTPQNQDAAALSLITRSNYDYTKPFSEQYHKLANTWASIPTQSGTSYYNMDGSAVGSRSGTPQPSKNAQDMINFYRQQLALYQNN